MSRETDALALFGFSIPDIVGLGLGFMAVVLSLVALAAAIIIFFLGTRHSRHLSEIENARRELLAINEGIRSDIEKNSALLNEVHLGFSVVLSLINLQGQERIISQTNHALIDAKLQKREINSIKARIKARELELHILANEGERCKASMQGLANTFGDTQTLEFLREYAHIKERRGEKSRDIYTTLGSLEGRMQLRRQDSEEQ